MNKKFKINISSYAEFAPGARHFYGHIEYPYPWRKNENYHRDIELNRPDPEPMPSWYDPDDAAHWTTIRFDTKEQLISAAKKWFLESSDVKPGDKLVIWKGYLD